VVQTPTRYITQEAFEQLCLGNPNGIFERMAQGELVEMSPVGVVSMPVVLSGEGILPGFELSLSAGGGH
jgi:hypothetical protein